MTTDGDGAVRAEGQQDGRVLAYRIGTAFGAAPTRSGVMAEKTLGGPGPPGAQPAAAGNATLRYSLPAAGPATGPGV